MGFALQLKPMSKYLSFASSSSLSSKYTVIYSRVERPANVGLVRAMLESIRIEINDKVHALIYHFSGLFEIRISLYFDV